MTRPPPMYSNFFCSPRFSSSSFRIPPRYSSRVITVASMRGSSICLISQGSGHLVGLVTSMTSPTVLVTRYRTPGAVVMRSMSNSRSRRSCTISRCSRPRKPQRKPKPGATELSASKLKALSLSRSFSSASRSRPCSCDSIGYSPANTMGLISSNPGSGSAAGSSASTMVSPILASETVLMLANMNPIYRIQPGEHHGLDLFESGQRLGGRIVVIHDGVADLGIGNGLDVGKHESDFAGGKLVARGGFGSLVAQPFHLQNLRTGRA